MVEQKYVFCDNVCFGPPHKREKVPGHEPRKEAQNPGSSAGLKNIVAPGSHGSRQHVLYPGAAQQALPLHAHHRLLHRSTMKPWYH